MPNGTQEKLSLQQTIRQQSLLNWSALNADSLDYSCRCTSTLPWPCVYFHLNLGTQSPPPQTPPTLIESLILKGAEAEWLTTLYQVPASALLWGWWKGARSISQPLQKRCASRYKSLRGSAIHFLIGGVNCRNVALWLLQSRPPVLVLRFSLGARVISADSLGKTDTGLSENPWTRGARFCASHRENTRLPNY